MCNKLVQTQVREVMIDVTQKNEFDSNGDTAVTKRRRWKRLIRVSEKYLFESQALSTATSSVVSPVQKNSVVLKPLEAEITELVPVTKRRRCTKLIQVFRNDEQCGLQTLSIDACSSGSNSSLVQNNTVVLKPLAEEITELHLLRGVLEFIPSSSMVNDNVPTDLLHAKKLWKQIRDTACIDGWLNIKMLKYEMPRDDYIRKYVSSSLENSLSALRQAITNYQNNATREVRSSDHRSFYVLGGQTPGPYSSMLDLFLENDAIVLSKLARQQHPLLTNMWQRLRKMELDTATLSEAKKYEKDLIDTFKELKTLGVQERKTQAYNRRWNVRTDLYCINLKYVFPEEMTWQQDFGPLIRNPFDADVRPAKAARFVKYQGPHLLFGCAVCLAEGAMTVLKKQFEGNLGEALIFLRSANFNKAVAPDEAVKQALAMR